jgi:hypothetical protein
LAIPLLYAFFPFSLFCIALIASSLSIAQLGSMATLGDFGLAKVGLNKMGEIDEMK